MTLLVYKDEQFAADTTATRNGSRERFMKLFNIKHMHFAFAGNTTAISTAKEIIEDVVTDYYPISVGFNPIKEALKDAVKDISGFAAMRDPDGKLKLYGFNYFAENAGWEKLDPEQFYAEGEDFAVMAALAANSANNTLSATGIIHTVADVCRSADTRYGVSKQEL